MATKKSAKAAPVQANESAAPVVAPVAEEVVTAYKGFDKNLQCRGMQYTVGETAVHKGKVEACEGGLHACTLPIDVFNYYKPNESRFCVVKVSGKLSRKDGDSKIASATMTVEAEIGIPGIVTATVKALLALVQKPTTGDYAHSATTGYYAHSATTGNSAHSATTGDYAHSATTGYYAIAAALGIAGRAKAPATGAIVLAHFNSDRSIKHIRASKVGENGIKADTWYVLDTSGEFEEVAQ